MPAYTYTRIDSASFNGSSHHLRLRFFSFAAPTKKKSSGTNPVIFPVGTQSATAGVGEVVKATDEVMLITTGAKPGDYLTASNADSLQDSEQLSKLPDTPYRSAMTKDIELHLCILTITHEKSNFSNDFEQRYQVNRFAPEYL